MKRTIPALLLCMTAGFLAAQAGVGLVLDDGRILEGVDVKLEDGQYILELATGGTLSIPVELVVKLQLSGDQAEEPQEPPTTTIREGEVVAGGPTNLEISEPEVLAGPPEPIRSPSTAEQLEALGEPASFVRGVFDQRWYPNTDWELDPRAQNRFAPSTWARAPIDSEWTIPSAFDAEDDATDFSPVAWSQGVVDPIWYPPDGFETHWAPLLFEPEEAASPAITTLAEPELPPPDELSTTTTTSRRAVYAGVEVARPTVLPEESVSEPATAPVLEPEDCARAFFEPLAGQLTPSRSGRLRALQDLSVEPFVEAEFSVLPLELFVGVLSFDGHIYKAVFSVVEGQCQLLNGDLGLLLESESSTESKDSMSAVAYNNSLREEPFRQPASDSTKLDYAFAVVTLLDSRFGAGQGGELKLLTRYKDLRRLSRSSAEECQVSKWQRRQEAAKAAAAFEPPQLSTIAGTEQVSFSTWSSHGGEIRHYTLTLAPDGKISFELEPVATHIGDHVDD